MSEPLDLDELDRLARAAQTEPDRVDEYMCPNCVTPWKCNGPHVSEPVMSSDLFLAALSPERVLSLIEAARLGQAWAAAEAAGRSTDHPGVLALRRHSEGDDYRATWYRPVDDDGGGSVEATTGPTPAAALQALAAKLRETPG